VSLALALSFGKVKKQALKEEISAQIDKLKKEGLVVTHLDSHEHVHLMPQVLDIALESCAEFSIPYIRFPRENLFVSRVSFKVKDLLRCMALRVFSVFARQTIMKFPLCHNSAFLGHFHSGRLNREILSFMADNIAEGTTELAVHPAVHSSDFLKDFPWYSNAAAEMDELMSEEWKKKLDSLNINPISHSEAVEQFRKIF
jgi:chitin disaccharide deacetylase